MAKVKAWKVVDFETFPQFSISWKHFPDCQLNSKDLILNYDCMTKVSVSANWSPWVEFEIVFPIQNEILKEIKRFERMQIDLKSSLDRLQYKIDHESKVRAFTTTLLSVLDNRMLFQEYYNLADQFQKLQIELFYLQNLNDKPVKAWWGAISDHSHHH